MAPGSNGMNGTNGNGATRLKNDLWRLIGVLVAVGAVLSPVVWRANADSERAGRVLSTIEQMQANDAAILRNWETHDTRIRYTESRIAGFAAEKEVLNERIKHLEEAAREIARKLDRLERARPWDRGP